VARRLSRRFFARPTEEVARDLVGQRLCRAIGRVVRVARIVEVEAYLGPGDAASHARRGPTPRSAIMFGPSGHAYVYLIYGLHNCLNVVAHEKGRAGAVLVRAAESLHDVIGSMRGPALLTRALGIDRRDNGHDLCAGEGLWLEDAPAAARIEVSPRIGVDYAGEAADWPLRFFDPSSREVSGRRLRAPDRARGT
jgi:DNA-3-methyladenine glycosylase